MQNSPQFAWNSKDFYLGLLWAVAGAVWAMMAESIEKGIFTFDWTAIWHTAVATAVLYLGHAFFSGPNNVNDLPAQPLK